MTGPKSSTIITNKRGQGPPAVAFPDVRRVETLELGRSRRAGPAGERWDDFLLNGQHPNDKT